MNDNQYVLTLACEDNFGIVAAVSGCLNTLDAFIVESSQFGCDATNRFFMRTVFSMPKSQMTQSQIQHLVPIAEHFNMDWHLQPLSYKPKTLIMVSQHSHCLNDVLHRVVSGSLPIDVVGIVSNHTDLEPMAQWYQIPFHHLPITPDTKDQQERALERIIEEQKIDLVVLARYMQILSGKLCKKLYGKAINIHHSFLPSFKGSKPYHQAFDRGVKLIGATAHYVTEDLDEGPIIEQEATRVNHKHSASRLVEMGRDVECLVLSRAIALHAERRVLLNGHKTVVFA
jgi:formyltetrahydrofolate deformylase